MTFVIGLWNKFTRSKAIDESSGKYETNYFESVYRIVYITGLSTADRGAGYLIYSSIIKSTLFVLLCSEFWYFFHVTWSVDTVIDSVNIIIIQLSSISKYRNMVAHRDLFKELASSMESPNFDISTKTRKKLADAWVKRNKNYLILLLMLGTCTLTAWYGYPLLDDIEYNLMVAVYLPFRYDNSSTYPIAYVMVMVAFTFMSYSVMVNDIIMQTYLMHLLCQFMVLKDCFSNILEECAEKFKGISENELYNNEKFREKYIKRLRNLINQHRFILNNTLKLRKILSGPMLGHLATSTILICSICYQIVMSISANFTKCLMSFLYLGYNMNILYILCRWCEEVTIQSEGIGVAVYCLGWERGLAKIPRVRSSLLLILTRASKPLVLTAGGMYDLSLASYANLVKTSYSALTVLLRFRQD